jgi:predicted nucleic acid-binding protein
VIVVDASAAIAALVHDGPARRLIADEQLHAPHLVDVEVASALRRLVTSRAMTARRGAAAVDVWGRMGLVRYGVVGLLARVWELRAGLSAYDASYVALAEALRCPLVTADSRLGRAPGLDCTITVVPR